MLCIRFSLTRHSLAVRRALPSLLGRAPQIGQGRPTLSDRMQCVHGGQDVERGQGSVTGAPMKMRGQRERRCPL